MNVTITDRSKKILRLLATGNRLSRAATQQAMGESRINTIREFGRLVDQGYVETYGEARATVYGITEKGRTVSVWNAEEYLAQEPDQRHARYTHIEPDLFKAIHGTIPDVPLAIQIGVKRRQELRSTRAAQKERERFVIELSWKSSKIEGNTYTLLDTERLIQDAKEAPGHERFEAVMILNHKKAFDYIWEHQDDYRTLTKSKIEEIHQLLVEGLEVQFGLRSEPVGITGTAYIPPASQAELNTYMRDAIDTINGLEQPLEKAMACLVLLPYLQAFVDGNKRTSRLLANAVLLAYGFPPLSYRSVDIEAYKGALILFYEQGTLANFRELFLEQLADSSISYFFPPSDENENLGATD
jgi:fido (protein-threonine AMPylation protein)